MDLLPIKGHSNFDLSLSKRHDGYFVKKTAFRDGIARLKQQAQKQIDFDQVMRKNLLISNFFEAAAVTSSEETAEQYSFFMKFYHGQSILNIIESEDIYQLRNIIDKLFMFLDWEFENAKLEPLDTKKMLDKLESLDAKITEKKLKQTLEVMKKYIQKNKNMKMHMGVSHGDFTFSNMIFSHKIVLIDFLDSFIETPLQDISKLLQEVRLQWTLLLSNEKTDKTKINIGYRYLLKQTEEKLKVLMKKYSIDRKTVEFFYIMTLLRIIPYTKNKHIFDLLMKDIIAYTEVLKK